MKIHYATTNDGKLKSLQRDLIKYNITIIQLPIKISEIRSSDVQIIAKEKVIYAYNQIKKPVVVLDAGFYIDSLNGFPRAYVNFTLETIGLEGILNLIKKKDRSCEFRECMAYLDGSLEEPKYFLAHVKGNLAKKLKGKIQKHLWSKLGLIFIPEGSKKTLAEMNYDEYLEWRKISREKNSTSKLFYNWLNKNRKI